MTKVKSQSKGSKVPKRKPNHGNFNPCQHLKKPHGLMPTCTFACET